MNKILKQVVFYPLEAPYIVVVRGFRAPEGVGDPGFRSLVCIFHRIPHPHVLDLRPH